MQVQWIVNNKQSNPYKCWKISANMEQVIVFHNIIVKQRLQNGMTVENEETWNEGWLDRDDVTVMRARLVIFTGTCMIAA